MMVPWYYIFFLVTVIAVAGIVMSKQYERKVKNKNLELLADLFIYFTSGLSLGFVIFNGCLVWWTVLISIVIGLFLSLILAAVLSKSDNSVDETTYTPEELIGKYGVIKSKYDKTKYLGYLTNESNDSIIVNIDVECYEGDIFEITDINENGIIAKKINK